MLDSAIVPSGPDAFGCHDIMVARCGANSPAAPVQPPVVSADANDASTTTEPGVNLMKRVILGLAVAVACMSAASAGVIDTARRADAAHATQTWSAWGGDIGFHWNTDLLTNLGVSVLTPHGPRRG